MNRLLRIPSAPLDRDPPEADKSPHTVRPASPLHSCKAKRIQAKANKNSQNY